MATKSVRVEYDTSPTDMLFMLEKLFEDLGVKYEVIDEEVSHEFVYEVPERGNENAR